MGIPKDAIKQKMSLSGVESKVLDYPETAPYITVLHYISNPQLGAYVRDTPLPNNTANTGIPPPPLPPPMPMLFGGSGGGSGTCNPARAGLLNAISSGEFKLKKVDPKEKLLAKLANNNPTGMKVPSLMDIQGALSRLKKVDIDYSDM